MRGESFPQYAEHRLRDAHGGFEYIYVRKLPVTDIEHVWLEHPGRHVTVQVEGHADRSTRRQRPCDPLDDLGLRVRLIFKAHRPVQRQQYCVNLSTLGKPCFHLTHEVLKCGARDHAACERMRCDERNRLHSGPL